MHQKRYEKVGRRIREWSHWYQWTNIVVQGQITRLEYWKTGKARYIVTKSKRSSNTSCKDQADYFKSSWSGYIISRKNSYLISRTRHNYIFNTDCLLNDYLSNFARHHRYFWRMGGGETGASSPKDKGLLKNWVDSLANALKRLAGKGVEALPVIVGSVAGAILSFFGKAVHGPSLLLLQDLLVGVWCKKLKRVRPGPFDKIMYSLGRSIPEWQVGPRHKGHHVGYQQT